MADEPLRSASTAATTTCTRPTKRGPTGRYLFTVFETGQAGIQRTDLRTMQTTTIWSSPAASPAPNSHVAFDASRWTPWGSFLTAEESWNDPGQPASPAACSR